MFSLFTFFNTSGQFFKAFFLVTLIVLVSVLVCNPTQAAEIKWIGTTSGNWSDVVNWDGGVLPGAADDVLLDMPGTLTITHDQGANEIKSLVCKENFIMLGGTLMVAESVTSDGTVAIKGGTLAVNGTMQVNNTFTLEAGTLANATIQPGTGRQGLILDYDETVNNYTNSGILDAVTLNCDLDGRSRRGAAANVKNGLTLDGTAYLGGTNYVEGGQSNFNGYLLFDGSQTLGGTGTVVFGGFPGNELALWDRPGDPQVVLTIDSGIAVHGGCGNIGSGTNRGGLRGKFINKGKISSVQNGGKLVLDGDGWINNGTIEAKNGGSLELSSRAPNPTPIVNSGTITIGSRPYSYPYILNDVHGYFTQTSTGVLNLEIDPTRPNSTIGPLLFADSSPDFGGKLNISMASGFTPNTCDSYKIIRYPYLVDPTRKFDTVSPPFEAIYEEKDLYVRLINTPPSAPTLISPANNASTGAYPMVLKMSATDAQTDQPLWFKVELLQNGTVVRTYDQKSNPAGWDKPSHLSGETATLSVNAPALGIYQWRAYVSDCAASSLVSATRTMNLIATALNLCETLPVQLNAGALQGFSITIPQSSDLWIVLQKRENGWNSTAKLSLNGTVVATANGYDDALLHVAKPQAGTYLLEITGVEAGAGLLRACTDLPKITIGQQFVGTVHRSGGNDWTQLDLPAGATKLDFTIEYSGNSSTLEVWHGSLTGAARWLASESFSPPLRLSIPNPPAGRYYLKVNDRGLLSTPGTQARDYSILTAAIGASPPVVSGVTPNRGGNTGSVTVIISGGNLEAANTVKLTKAGVADIVAVSVGSGEPSKLGATFDLTGKTPGLYSVVVIDRQGRTVTFVDAFTIESGGGPVIWVRIIGRDVVRADRPNTVTIVYGNDGNVDAHAIPITVSGIPIGATVTPVSGITTRPLKEGDPAPDLSQIPLDIATGDNQKAIPFVVPLLGAGQTGQIELSIRFPQGEAQLKAEFKEPLVEYKNGELLAVIERTTCATSLTEEAAALVGLIPGVDCAIVIQSYLAGNMVGLATDAGEALQGQQPTQAEEAVALFNLVAGAVGALEDCLQKEILGKLGDAWAVLHGGYQVVKNCWKPVTDALKNTTAVGSIDPNEKVGASGFGAAHFVPGAQPLPYTILFENLPSASASAQEVVITDQLDPALVDLNSFSLGSITFGNKKLTPPPNLQSYLGFVDLRPANNLIVRVNANLEKATGLVTWRFESLDPATGEFTTDPIAGFLPPNITSPEGEGSVSFLVKPKDNSSGAVIPNNARIIFDANVPIETNLWSNTLDNDVPSSQVKPLPAITNSSGILVEWMGSDLGSGVASYDIFVSKNGAPFTAWLTGTPLTSATYNAERGHTYRFYSVARDNVGHREASPAVPDATTFTSAALFLKPFLSIKETTNATTNCTFEVKLGAASTRPVTVNWATADVTATAGQDYTAASGTLSFAVGETVKTITVVVQGDTIREENETFRVLLSNPVNAALVVGQGTGSILDTNAATLSVGDVTIAEGDTGSKNAIFTVVLSSPSSQTVTVNAVTANGSALSPGDYAAGGFNLSFAPGQTQKTFAVAIKGDGLDESNEIFYVLLSAAANAGIGRGRAIGTITDNDTPPALTVDDLVIAEGQGGTRRATIYLRLSKPSGQVVKVNLATQDGTTQNGNATAGVDYVGLPLTPATVAFTPGRTVAIAFVTIKGDTLIEPNETFRLNLSNPLGATIADAQALCTITNDDRAPLVSVNDVTITEGSVGTKTATFTVTLSAPSWQAVSVNYATSDGVARAGSDYITKSGTLTFTPGQVSKTLSITIYGDKTIEANETFYALLSAPFNATLGRGRGIGTLTNDDIP